MRDSSFRKGRLSTNRHGRGTTSFASKASGTEQCCVPTIITSGKVFALSSEDIMRSAFSNPSCSNHCHGKRGDHFAKRCDACPRALRVALTLGVEPANEFCATYLYMAEVNELYLQRCCYFSMTVAQSFCRFRLSRMRVILFREGLCSAKAHCVIAL